ncbi:MAG: glycosyltransferase [Verrucomicrobiota bacterium]
MNALCPKELSEQDPGDESAQWIPERIAIIHDWLPEVGGAEKVLGEMLNVFPAADLYSLIDFIPESERAFLHGKQVQTTFLQQLPAVRRFYRACLPLMPLAVEHIDLSRYQLVISSSYAVAKGVITGPEQLHLCYCHSPIRYAWDLQEQYLLQSGSSKGVRGFLARALLHYIRIWDSRTSNGVDAFATNSKFVARRIWKVYRRRSRVIYPPVDAAPALTPMRPTAAPFYLSLGRLVPYKRVDLIVETFRGMPQLNLIVIGDGPERSTLEKRLPGNIVFLGRQSRQVVLQHLQAAQALIFAAEEDFGIVPVEAQAMGTPVIAYGKGGACETVLHNKTGILFMDQTPESLEAAITCAEQTQFDGEILRQHAAKFSPECFRRDFGNWATHKWKRFVTDSMTRKSVDAPSC